MLSALRCFTNNQSMKLFGQEDLFGLSICIGANVCYEAVGEPEPPSPHAIYSASCSSCPPWQFKSECMACNTSLCNTKMANQIRLKHRRCYWASKEETIGVKNVWCIATVTTCHWAVEKLSGKTFYHAGCGSWTHSDCKPRTPNDPSCRVCSSDFCNLPDSIINSTVPPKKFALNSGLKDSLFDPASPDYGAIDPEELDALTQPRRDRKKSRPKTVTRSRYETSEENSANHLVSCESGHETRLAGLALLAALSVYIYVN